MTRSVPAGASDSEQRLRAQVRHLKELRVADADYIARLEADSKQQSLPLE